MRKRSVKRPAARVESELLRSWPQDLFDFAPVMWFVLDSVGTIIEINPSACQVLGRSRRFLIGTPFNVLVREEFRRDLLDHMRRSRTEDGTIETSLWLKDAVGIPLAIRLYTQSKKFGSVTLYPTIGVDVSEQMELERARGAAERQQKRAEQDRQIARASEAAKDELLAMVSHELRNPLSPALTAASYLEALPDLPARAREMAAVIKRNIELEARLIDDLLDVSRLTRGRLDLRVCPVDAHEILKRAVDACGKLAEDRHVTITLDLMAEQHHTMGDEARLQQVFWNLLTNAVKFSNPGDFVLVRTRSDEGHVLHVSVRDFGAGMDVDTVNRLFAPFEAPATSPDRSARMGLGLGLTIARGIVEAHGGQVWGSSEGPERGSHFEVELVTCNAPKVESAIDAPEQRNGLSGTREQRVLVIEDDVDSGTLLAMYLGRLGYVITVAHTLREGLDALDQPWDVVLSDIGLGDGSGLDIARRVTELGRRPGLLVAVSGYVTPRDIAASREAGFDCHLAKPVDLDQLVEILKSAASRA